MSLKPNPRHKEALVAFLCAYIALATGLKLDGVVGLPWTLLLAPVWVPMAAITILAMMACTLYAVVALLDRLARKLTGRL